MTAKSPDASLPSQRLPVYRADDFVVTNGANLGDALSFSSELVPDDIYALSSFADQHSLSLVTDTEGAHFVASDSTLGTPGARIFLDCVATFMPPSGDTIEVLVLVEVDADGGVVNIFAGPLAPMTPKTDYALVGVSRDEAAHRLAQLACVSFTKGTRITLATGEQRPVEELAVGDRVLTRDDGAQEVRWIGHTVHRATGEFAPIVITAGTLNNAGDLCVSPDHRLFVYQRQDRLGVGRSGVLVKARHLVNDTTVRTREGGFVDYYQIMFDRHQIIFAEGISAETMQIDTRTSTVIPEEVKARLRSLGAESRGPALPQFEVDESQLRQKDVAALLKRASSK